MRMLAKWWRRSIRWNGAWCLLVTLLLVAGCGNFFDPSTSTSTTTSSSGSGSSSSSTDDAVYVANSNAALETISSYSLSSTGALTSLSGSPSELGELPATLAENPAGTLLFAGTETGEIYVYVVESGGVLALGNSDGPVAEILASSMVVDPSGQWLLVLSDTGLSTSPLVYVYSINQSTGQLTQTGTQLALDTGTATQLAFAPNGTNLFAALGTGGVDSLTFAPGTGALTKLNVLLTPLGSDYADQGVAVDPASKYLFVTETGTDGVRVLTINSDGTLTSVAGSPFASGAGPKSVLVDSTGAYVYVANSVGNSISAYTLGSTGALTAIAGSPFGTGTTPYALAEDNTHSFVVAACLGGSPDLQVFSIAGSTAAAPGALSSTATASTGSVSPAGAIAVATTP